MNTHEVSNAVNNSSRGSMNQKIWKLEISYTQIAKYGSNFRKHVQRVQDPSASLQLGSFCCTSPSPSRTWRIHLFAGESLPMTGFCPGLNFESVSSVSPGLSIRTNHASVSTYQPQVCKGENNAAHQQKHTYHVSHKATTPHPYTSPPDPAPPPSCSTPASPSATPYSPKS